MPILICPMCLKETTRFHQKSHIIPEWMYDNLYQPNEKILLIKLNKVEIEKKQKGIYGAFICENCEIMFGADDRYASLTLGKKNKAAPEFTSLSFTPLHEEFIQITGFDFKKLQKFIFSIVLRMCFYSQEALLLKKHLDALRINYLNSATDDLSHPIFIDEAHDDDPQKYSIFLPYKTKIDNHHAIQFKADGYTFTIIVSSHEISNILKLMRLRNEGSIILFKKYWKETGMAKATLQQFKALYDKYGRITPGQKIRALKS